MTNKNYAHPEVLVDTAWVAEHLDDRGIRLIEVDVDPSLYETGHIPGAIAWNWERDTQDTMIRDLPKQDQFEELMSRSGIEEDTGVILYGDSNNWFAAFAFWLLKIYGYENVRLMNGGRAKWEAEERPLTTEVPQPEPTEYRVKRMESSLRALRDYVLKSISRPGQALVDVRSPEEFSGERLAPESAPQEGAQRKGHIPGAANIPWGKAVAEDGTFKPFNELKEIYESQEITAEKEVIAYCRIGERSAHSWFVLKYLLGYPKVRNYDGSWTEWGSLVGVPIER